MVHAAGESSRLSEALPSNTNAVAIVAHSEAELLSLEAKLKDAAIPFKGIRESEGVHAGQLMAIGCCPGYRAELKRYFSSYPLLR